MDFIDWRKPSAKKTAEEERASKGKYQGRRYEDFIEQQIREAMERGVFDNLEGFGKPLKLEENVYAGDRAMGFNLLKSNGYAPAEVEMVKEIRSERVRIEAKLARLQSRGKMLRRRRIPPFLSEKRTFNIAVEKAVHEYQQTLQEINRKILTLNVIAPISMQQEMLPVEQLVQDFRDSCPLFPGVPTS